MKEKENRERIYIKAFEKYLTQNHGFKNTDFDLIVPYLVVKKYSKREVVQKEDTKCNKIFFIFSGVLRTFYLDSNGKEYSLLFSFFNSFVSCPDSYLSEEVSRYSIDAIQNSVLISIDKAAFTELMEKNIKYQKLGLNLLDIFAKDLLEANLLIRQSDASDFYQKIRDEKEDITKVPLKYLSSYLGIHQNSLSRIRSLQRKNIESV